MLLCTAKIGLLLTKLLSTWKSNRFFFYLVGIWLNTNKFYEILMTHLRPLPKSTATHKEVITMYELLKYMLQINQNHILGVIDAFRPSVVKFVTNRNSWHTIMDNAGLVVKDNTFTVTNLNDNTSISFTKNQSIK